MIARLEGTMRLARWFTTIILSLTIAASAAAQSQITTGVVDGTVVDASGAVVPGVDVEVRNVDTNLARTFVPIAAAGSSRCNCRPGATRSASSCPGSPRSCRKT